ncbi:hypothetical protein [Methylobacterium sp. WL69]|uniref:hypothetical protein n=1 Tax=Methylobacterium sp. WL69 TaxID=2603893 RepID=UPI0016505382|nr:hypothetical protein [Methylobacterium sp. WL69]
MHGVHNEVARVEDEITPATATTLAGLRLQAEIALSCIDETDAVVLVWSVVSGVRTVAARAMSNVHTYTPRRPAPAPRPRLSFNDTETRQRIEEAAQSALDTAERLIALLDHLETDPDREEGGDAEPSLGAPEHHASQIAWLRGTPFDHEGNSSEHWQTRSNERQPGND